MAACIRIYTVMGKENCRTVDSFTLHTEHFNSDAPEAHFVRFHDRDNDGREAKVIEEIDRIVQGGQPCNMHIRYKDQEVEAVCKLDGCTYCNNTMRILCNKPVLDIISYADDISDNWDNEGGMIT